MWLTRLKQVSSQVLGQVAQLIFLQLTRSGRQDLKLSGGGAPVSEEDRVRGELTRECCLLSRKPAEAEQGAAPPRRQPGGRDPGPWPVRMQPVHSCRRDRLDIITDVASVVRCSL